MAHSSRRWMRTSFALTAAFAWIACGAGEESKPTGLKMGDTPQPTTETATTIKSTGTNSPPEIDEIVLRPETPRPGERLTAVVEAYDPDGDPVSLRYHWTVDGTSIDNSSNELMLRDVEKGSYVEVSVIARDQEDESDTYEAGVTIANRPPVIRGVVFEPLGEVNAASDVTAAPRSFDPDGDEVEYNYSWRVNGSEVSTEALLEQGEFRRGDEIVLEVIAFDGDDESEPLVSDPVPVVNARPKITSSPSGFTGERFRYTVKAEDPDGDRNLRFHLVKGPDGMSIDNLSGLVTWNPQSDQDGNHRVEITVEDQKGGEDHQNFELTLGTSDGEETPAAPAR